LSVGQRNLQDKQNHPCITGWMYWLRVALRCD